MLSGIAICYLRIVPETLQRTWSFPIVTSDIDSDPRVQAIRCWLDSIDGLAGAEMAPASADASFRRYFRVRTDDVSRIVMDAPPEKENCEPFIRIAEQLVSFGLNAPVILEKDLQQGFLLLSDLGSIQFLPMLQDNAGLADTLYGDAIDALVQLQENGATAQRKLPPYDDKLLRFELSLFSDWLCARHLGVEIADKPSWINTCNTLVDNALEQPGVFVHRDYHSRNLMFVDENNPGILDFQDAVEGPYTYDLVSLLKDCYISWPADQVLQFATTFFEKRRGALPNDIDQATFVRHFELMGVQRQLKAAGIFARLNHRDGKPTYMLDIPRTLNYVLEVVPRYTELAWLGSMITENVLPALPQENA